MDPLSSFGSSRTRRRRILFVAEAVTLAHIARPAYLARGLDPSRYEAILATSPRYQALWQDLCLPIRAIDSIPETQFREALAKGVPLYDAETLRGYIRQDLEVIEATDPEIIIGDFRLSLAVSARLAKLPYLAITNAYWSPQASPRFPMPELPVSRRLGVPLTKLAFSLVRPLAFALHAEPLNRVRREHGMKPLGRDLRRTYTEADRTLYADVPELVPTIALPGHHHYLGPIRWSPKTDRPDWWAGVPDDRPVIYVTPGSSGRAELLFNTVEALADLPVSVLAATVRTMDGAKFPENVRQAPFLPGREVAERAQLVICNGGSPTSHQALEAGVPVLGVAANMDQHLNMEAIQRFGAGLLVRSEHAKAQRIRAAVDRLLHEPSYANRAGQLAEIFRSYDAVQRLDAILKEIP